MAHIPDEEADTERLITCPKSHSPKTVKLRFRPRQSSSRDCVLNHGIIYKAADNLLERSSEI